MRIRVMEIENKQVVSNAYRTTTCVDQQCNKEIERSKPMSTIKRLSEKNRNLLFELVKEIKAEGYAEGFEAGKLVAESENSLKKIIPKFEVNS